MNGDFGTFSLISFHPSSLILSSGLCSEYAFGADRQAADFRARRLIDYRFQMVVGAAELIGHSGVAHIVIIALAHIFGASLEGRGESQLGARSRRVRLEVDREDFSDHRARRAIKLCQAWC